MKTFTHLTNEEFLQFVYNSDNRDPIVQELVRRHQDGTGDSKPSPEYRRDIFECFCGQKHTVTVSGFIEDTVIKLTVNIEEV